MVQVDPRHIERATAIFFTYKSWIHLFLGHPVPTVCLSVPPNQTLNILYAGVVERDLFLKHKLSGTGDRVRKEVRSRPYRRPKLKKMS